MTRLLSTLLLTLLVASPARAFDPWADTARYELVFEVELAGLPEGDLRLWLPAPRDAFFQHLLGVEVEAPIPHRETMDALGNRMVHLAGPSPGAGAAPLVARYDVLREPGFGLPEGEIVKESPDDPRRHLAARRRVPLEGIVAEFGAKAAEGKSGDAEKIRAIYDWVVSKMRYAKEGDGWGQGDAVWACTSKSGNCTDFHSVFLGMARSQGVPARFVMGVPIPPESEAGEIHGYHCWAQAHQEGVGWLPLDASEASKAGTPDAYFGKLPSDRVSLSYGRDLVLDPAQAGEPLNFFFEPYVEIDGQPVEPPPWTLRFRRVPMRTTSPSAG